LNFELRTLNLELRTRSVQVEVHQPGFAVLSSKF
jgi:hypothetical protein